MSERATCETCRWWQDCRPNLHIDGMCRRHAPQPSNGNMGQYNSGLWPATMPNDWCGEHQPREVADE